MNKIIIIGSSGAGKSTFSKKLGRRLGVKVFHLDALMWKPNWEMTERGYQIETQKEIMKQDAWIIDGNYNGTMDIRIAAADTIIFFDINRWICIYQVIKRFFQYRGKTRPDMQVECPEKLDINFFKFIWNYPKKQKVLVEERLSTIANDKEITIFKNRKQADKFLEQLN